MAPPDKRKDPPDVLGEILGEIPAPARQEAEEKPAGQPPATSKPARQPTSKTAQRKAGKPARKPAPAPVAEEPKLKATFYLSPSLLDRLEEAQLHLRRLALLDDRGKVSKSLIVEMSLLAALQELRDKDKESLLARMLARQ